MLPSRTRTRVASLLGRSLSPPRMTPASTRAFEYAPYAAITWPISASVNWASPFSSP